MSVSAAIGFLSPLIETHDFTTVLTIGVTGLQGLGKSYTSAALTLALTQRYPHLNVITISMDDFYLPHHLQKQLGEANADNPLLQGRGLPGTHDLPLLQSVVGASSTRLPSYDKSRFGGEGDRLETWRFEEGINIVVFEGWFNGFRSLGDAALRELHESSVPLQQYDLAVLQTINTNLKEYEPYWQFDAFVLLYSEISMVYQWRIQQEHALIAEKGAGMSDEEVRRFVDRYMPCYIMYYERLHKEGTGCPMLCITLDEHRGVVSSLSR